MIPTVEEAAAMADHIYKYDKDSSYSDRQVKYDDGTLIGWRLINVWYGRESLKMGIYIRDSDDWHNPSEYVVVFRGTSTWFDDDGLSSEAWNNIEAATSGNSADMWDAMNYGLGFVRSVGDTEVTFVGHSKGGGEAIVAADYTDKNAITFNAANFNFGKYVSGKGKGQINNYYVRGEALHSLIGRASIGTNHWLDTQYWTVEWDIFGWEIKVPAPVKNHHMDAVKKALGM